MPAPATIDTTEAGTGTFTVTATDYAGNTATQSVTYTVLPATTTTTTTTTTTVTAAQPPPARPVAPVLSTSPVLSAAGVVTLHLRCGAASRCAGLAELSLSGQAKPASSARYSLAAGHSSTLALPLDAAARRQLKHNRNRLKATLTLIPSGAHAVTSTKRLTLAVMTTPH